uniref:Bifunctional lysine-specific demethylase and histidyl-hydroxylase n=1 Tax=Graphocephala atropunctata TaxID=36148 RepID=A0A1B6LY87_9HEMI
MKIKEPVSAFSVYSERFKQKKNTKPVLDNGIKKIGKQKKHNNDLKKRQMREICYIMEKLAEQSNTANNDIVKNITAAMSKTEVKNTSAFQVSLLDGNTTETNSTGPVPITETDNQPSKGLSDSTVKETKKVIKPSKASKIKGNKHLGGCQGPVGFVANIDQSLPGVENNQVIGPFLNKYVFKGKSVKICKKSKQYSKKKEDRDLISKKIPSDKGKTNSKQKILKQKKLNSIATSNKISSSKIDVGKNNLPSILKKNKKLITKAPKVNKVDFKNKKDNSEESNWMNQENSILAGKCLFEWLIVPISHENFMSDYWEKRPLLIHRENNRNYFSKLLSTPAIDKMLRENVVYFTKHLDVTSYEDGVRNTHNDSGRAQPNVVWDFYSNGCSIRLLNPQVFLPKIHALNATLQEYFGCFVGANVYLTPPNSQGFAPHFDDIEAFILQIEGKKHWKVYSPRNGYETLPRFSSPNFSQEEIGEPMLEVTLEPGDMLYFPRGYIHQASTVEGEHSLHITLSAYQKTAWVDLFEKALPLALRKAAAEDVEFRRGLPRDYLNVEHRGSNQERLAITYTAKRLMARLGHYMELSLRAGVDQMGAQFMHDALPPVLTPEEKQKSSLGDGLKMVANGKIRNRVELEMDTEVKLVKANVCRLAEVEGEVRVYYCLDNPLEYHADVPQFLVLPAECIPVVTQLARSYPAYVQVKRLPHDDKDILITLISDLWDAGLLVAKGLKTTSEYV